MKKQWAVGLALSLLCLHGTAWGHIIFLRNIFVKLHSAKGSSHGSTTYTYYTPGCTINCVPSDGLADTEKRCVQADSKVGAVVVLPDRRIMRVESYLDGSESHCRKPEYPRYASLVRGTSPQPTRTSNAKIDVPDNWKERPLTEVMKAGGTFLVMYDDQTHSGVIVSTKPRSEVTDMDTFAATRVSSQLNKLKDSAATPMTRVDINGMPAWRYEITGLTKSGQSLTYITTMYQGEEEVIVTSVWTKADQFAAQRLVLAGVADSLSGVKDEDTPKEEAASPLPQQMEPLTDIN